MTNQNSIHVALEEAIKNGFSHDFRFDQQGLPMPYSEEFPNLKILEIVPCECGATLYLMAADGRQGNYIHHWE